jgi:hypothetical protein
MSPYIDVRLTPANPAHSKHLILAAKPLSSMLVAEKFERRADMSNIGIIKHRWKQGGRRFVEMDWSARLQFRSFHERGIHSR